MLFKLSLYSIIFTITQSYKIDYILTYDGNKEPYMRFSEAFTSSNIIQNHSNISECISNCTNNSLCNGYFVYNNSCNELYNIEGYVYTDLNCSSYTKIIHYEGRYNHSLEGITIGTRDSRNSTIYLDLNHNGILDFGEPNVSTNLFFYFDGLTPGNYLIREKNRDGCYNLLPDIYGYADPLIDDTNYIAYVDTIYNYRGYNHTILGNNSDILNNLIDFNNNTYVSFYNMDSIIVGFSNSTVIDRLGKDIVFVLHNISSDIQARVSVSTLNNMDLEFLGILNETHYSFDLSTINYSYPVNHIHLEFFSNNYNLEYNNTLNIASIIGEHIIDYIPYNAYYFRVPTTEQFAFIRDCDYLYACEDFCDYSMKNWDEFISCNTGCLLAERDLSCDCLNLNFSNPDNLYSNPLYPNRVLGFFGLDECARGCEYQINKYVFPNFTFGENGKGLEKNIINTQSRCNNMSCLDDMISECYDLDCLSFSLGTLSLFYNSTDYYYSNYSNYFLHNPIYEERYNDLNYNTYPPSSSIPTHIPTYIPSYLPTSSIPTYIPSYLPTSSIPTHIPSYLPTSSIPTYIPSYLPTSSSPTHIPTNMPTSSIPTNIPTNMPTLFITTTTNMVNLNINNNLDEDEKFNYKDYIVYLGLVLIILILIILLITKKKNQKRRRMIESIETRPSFTNPIYSNNQEIREELMINFVNDKSETAL